MDKLRIQGGRPLSGEIPISGAKNAALPALAATLLTAETVRLERIPGVVDIRTMARLLSAIGAEVDQDGAGGYQVRSSEITEPVAPYELVKTMRASSLVLGPLLARCGRARVSMPGGCAIGARPVNLHVESLERLGARFRQEAGYIEAVAEDGLRGARITFPKITVTGTEDLMMAATLAQGETIIENAAREPEVVDLAVMLRKMGAKIEGHGTSTITIQGVSELGGAEHAVISDRIEAGTYLIAGALAGQGLRITGTDAGHIEALTTKLSQAGVPLEHDGDAWTVSASRPILPIDITTEEFPGFPTDMQAQWMALMAFANGDSHIVETIFENRFMHAAELSRMGAPIEVSGSRATIRGRATISGANVMASDLRASASLVLAALAAEGETTIHRVYHLDRGYEDIDGKLRAVGAAIERVAS